MPSFDAVLLLSFGGPEAPDDVMPFLRRVTATAESPTSDSLPWPSSTRPSAESRLSMRRPKRCEKHSKLN